jgi:hypothetical protein
LVFEKAVKLLINKKHLTPPGGRKLLLTKGVGSKLEILEYSKNMKTHTSTSPKAAQLRRHGGEARQRTPRRGGQAPPLPCPEGGIGGLHTPPHRDHGTTPPTGGGDLRHLGTSGTSPPTGGGDHATTAHRHTGTSGTSGAKHYLWSVDENMNSSPLRVS